MVANRSIVIALCVCTALVAGCGGTATPTPTIVPPTAAPTPASTTAPTPPPSEIASTVPPTPTVTATPELPASVDIVAAGALMIPATHDVDWTVVVEGEAWVAGLGDGIGVLDASGKLTRSVAAPGSCESMDVGFEHIWSASCDPAGVIRVDPATGKVDRMDIDAPILDSEASIGAGEGAVWVVAGVAGDQLVGIDPKSLEVAHRYTIPLQGAGVRAAFGGVWVTRPNFHDLLRVDPVTGEVVATIELTGPRFLAVGEDGVWVLNAGDGTVSHVDPATNTVKATISVGGEVPGGDITVGGGSVWVRGGPYLLTQIDPVTDTVTARYGPQSGSGSVGADDGAVWATAHDVAMIWRLPLK
jgi:virginiamycin B lyase